MSQIELEKHKGGTLSILDDSGRFWKILISRILAAAGGKNADLRGHFIQKYVSEHIQMQVFYGKQSS